MKREKRPVVQKRYVKKPTVVDVILAVFKLLILLAILTLPMLVFFLPNYWQNFDIAPRFYFSSLVLFFIPICIILTRRIWRCPFFLAPFSVSFVLSSQITNYLTFLFIYWFFLGSVLTILAIRRTDPPYRDLELKLFLTTYFIDYFEVRNFWRVVVLLAAPIGVPSIFFLGHFFW